MDLTSLLTPGAVDRGGYWSVDDAIPQTEIWDRLAADDPVHAAISAVDEAGEERKSAEQIELLEERLSGGVVVDMGCGYGRLAKYLLPRRTFAGYVGLDGSPTMLGLFRERYGGREAEQGTPLLLVRAPLDAVPLKDETVHAVVTSAVLLHNPKPVARTAIAEARRVLRPGGRLILLSDLRNAGTLTGLQNAAYLAALRLRGQSDRNGPIRSYRRRELGSMLAGFSRVELRPVGFQLLPKSLLGLPYGLNRAYRRWVWTPVEAVARRIVPRALQRHMCDHWQVVATK